MEYNRPEDFVRDYNALLKRVEALERSSRAAPWYSYYVAVDAADRDAQIISPVEGMLAYLQDDDIYTRYDGAAWVNLIPDPYEEPLWQDYAFTWSTTGTQPVLSGGSYSGRYCQVGKTVHFGVHIITGGGTNYGTGRYQFSLPVTAKTADGTTSDLEQFVHCKVFSATAALAWCGQGVFVDGGTKVVLQATNGGALGNVTNIYPFTGNTGSTYRVMGSYEAA